MTSRNLLFARLFYLIIISGLTATSAKAFIPPWISVSLDAGHTTNLFADSTGITDKYASIDFDIEQPFSSYISVYYNGNITRYADSGDLGNIFNSAGLNLGTEYKNFENLWFSAGALNLAYNQYYSIYDRNKYFISLGGLYKQSEPLRFKSIFYFDNTNYPSYSDKVKVDYFEYDYSFGFNYTFRSPYAFDLENGIQYRHYYQLDPHASTSFYYLKIRFSGSLNNRTGINTSLALRNQMSTSQDELYALYNGGIDPANLLWQGWMLKTGVSRIIRHWVTNYGISYRDAEFMETSVITGIPHRNDNQWIFSASAKTSLPLNRHFFSLWIFIDYEYEYNRSNDTYFDYDSHNIHLGLTLENY